MKKNIGITLNLEFLNNSEIFFRSNSCWIKNYLCLYKKYNVSVSFLPHNVDFIDHYSELYDGLIISGNGKHINPELYNQKKSEFIKQDEIDLHRTSFEIDICRKFISLDKSIFGICGGHQIINVALGGSLYQNIPTDFPNSRINHSQSDRRYSKTHKVNIIKETNLFRITGKDQIWTNTSHIQSINELGKNLIINATSEDGIIEGVEHKYAKFCLGVQWHPEFNVTKSDSDIFESFLRSL